jgi:hypothetical protein
MARKLNPAVWDLWQQRMSGQRASGLSIAAYCRREGIANASFHAWKRKLRALPPTRSGRRGAAAASRSRKEPTPVRHHRQRRDVASFPAASRREADFLQLPIREVRSSPWIELALIDGTVVRIPQENLAALATLLRVLRGESSHASGEVRHA